jgi:5,10-methylenetetrahydrofolate reductase
MLRSPGHGAPGIHFYTMNKSHSATKVVEALREKGLLPA